MSDELLEAALRNLFIFLWLWSLMPAGIFGDSQNLASEKMEVELRAYRLQQFESSGRMYGSKAWKILYEAVSLNESALRKCMVLKWQDLVGMDLESKFGNVPIGALLVVIPADLNSLAEAERQAFMAIEQQLAELRTELAVYFTPDSPALQTLLSNVAMTSKKATTALQQLLNSMVADNYQVGSTNTATGNVAQAKVYNVVAQLNAAERGQPYLFIVAHYDTYGIIPALVTGADSNGSGVAVLLELLVIFAQLYALPSHRARFNLVFVLSAGGKFSYQGSRSFIDDFNERFSDETISLAVCLDGLAKGYGLHAHTSKMPSTGSSANRFLSILANFADKQRPVEVVAKKINLGADKLAWEHEIYNIRRIHALSLSHFRNHSDPERNTLLDTPSRLNLDALEANARLIANSLVAFVFDLNSQLCQNAHEGGVECAVLNQAVNVKRERLTAWLQLFGSKARPIVVQQQQLVTNLLETVKQYSHQAHLGEVAVNDFVLYDVIEDTLTANVVKPAIFELLLAAGICVYLYAVYYLALHAQPILEGTIGRIRKLI